MRLGLSMLELVISLSLFSVVMVGVLQAMVSTTNYVEFDSSRTDLETATIQLQNRVLNDFANTAWFFEFDKVGDKLQIDSVTKLRIPLYPKVSSDFSTIEFLKLRSSIVTDASPKKEHYAYTNFRSTTTEPVGFSQYIDALPTPLMIVNPNYKADPQWFVAPVWESKEKNDFDNNQDAEYLRHYLYVVEPNAHGIKCLVRKYRNPPDEWVLDEVLAEGVAKVEFKTSYEDTAYLNPNQIRISIILERNPRDTNAGTAIKRRVDLTVAMRSINQEN